MKKQQVRQKFSLNHLVGAHQHALRDGDTKGLGGFHVDRQFVLGRLFDRQIAGLCTLEDSVHVVGGTPALIAELQGSLTLT